MNRTTAVLWCSCEHAYQDAAYGAHMRVHNRRSEQSVESAVQGGAWRCTVCGRTRGKGE